MESTWVRASGSAGRAARASHSTKRPARNHARGVDILLAPPVLVSRAAAGAAAAVVRHGVSRLAVRAAGSILLRNRRFHGADRARADAGHLRATGHAA